MDGLIADRYADALFQAAVELNLLEDIKDQLDSLIKILEDQTDLMKIMDHPMISPDEKKSVIETIFGEKISNYLLNFFKILIDKNRFGNIESIRSSFIDLYNESRGIVEVVATTKDPLDEDRKTRLTEVMSKRLDQEVIIKNVIDSNIIGGIVLDYKGQRIDKSIQNKINKLEKVLKS